MGQIYNAIILLFMISLSLWTFSAEADQVYKWVDENGQVHYGARQPPQEDFDTVNIQKAPVRQAPVKKNESPEVVQNSPLDEEEDLLQAEKRAEMEKKRQELARFNCQAAQKNKQTLLNFRRIEIPDGEGGKRRLDEDERAQRLAEADKLIKQYCN